VAVSSQGRPQRKVMASSAFPMPRPRNVGAGSCHAGSGAACWLVVQGGSPPFPAMLPAARLAAPAWPPTAPPRISLEPKAPLAECEDEMPCWSTGEPRRARPGAVNAPDGVAARATRRMLASILILIRGPALQLLVTESGSTTALSSYNLGTSSLAFLEPGN
jgi:hypothetical protein